MSKRNNIYVNKGFVAPLRMFMLMVSGYFLFGVYSKLINGYYFDRSSNLISFSEEPFIFAIGVAVDLIALIMLPTIGFTMIKPLSEKVRGEKE